MAAPATTNTLRETDFPDGVSSKKDAAKLFQILNPFLAQTQVVTTAGTSLGQNVDGQVVTLDVKTPASDWVPVTSFSNSWVNFGGGFAPAAYRRDASGNVWVRGLIKSGTVATTAFTLPVGYRPSADGNLIFAGVDGAGTGIRLDVQTNGAVVPQGGNNTFWSVSCSFAEASNTPGVYTCFPVNARLKDGKKPQFILAKALNTKTNKVDACEFPAWTYLGQGQTGNLVRIDNVPGLALGASYSVALFIFF